MRGKTRNIGIAAIICGTVAGTWASRVRWEELPGPAGEFAFWTTRILAVLGGLYLLGLLIWAWKSNREQNRLIDRRARFQARLTPETQAAFKSEGADPSERLHRH
jgi:hypothetical protein